MGGKNIIFSLISLLLIFILIGGCVSKESSSDTLNGEKSNKTIAETKAQKKSTNTLNSNNLVTVGLTEIVPKRSEMDTSWSEKNSWGSNIHEIMVLNRTVNLSADITCHAGLMNPGPFDYHNYENQTECAFFRATKAKDYRISIDFLKLKDINNSKREFEYLRNGMATGTKYEKEKDSIVVGNEMLTAEAEVSGSYWEHVIIFRRNNVVVRAEIRQTWAGKLDSSRTPQLRGELENYVILIDNKIK
jgi:hypothetical protein